MALAAFRAAALTTTALGPLPDAFLVRQLLVPALVVLVGRIGWWPGWRPGRPPGEREEALRADGDRR